MSKQDIYNNDEVFNYIVDENNNINKRLEKYDEYDCLAFLSNYNKLIPQFAEQIKGNSKLIEAFEKNKQKSIKDIQKKQKDLPYKEFVKYIFNRDRTENIFDYNETIIYDITPNNEQEIIDFKEAVNEFLNEETTIHYTRFRKPFHLHNNLIIPFNSFEAIKSNFEESLNKPFADKEEVIKSFENEYITPFQTQNNCISISIYNHIKKGKDLSHINLNFTNYQTELAVIEILKFEQYLNEFNEQPTNKEVHSKQKTNSEKKLSEKWFALLYWLELTAYGNQPPKNREGEFIKSKIISYRESQTGKDGQSFYRAFKDIDLNNSRFINSRFGKDWQKTIFELSKNDTKIKKYINQKYNSKH